jgi:thioredoxin reductase (NADPH)
MSRYLVDRIAGLPNVEVLTQTSITGFEGRGGMVNSMRWRGLSGEEMHRPVRHLFLFIDADPNTDWLARSGVVLDPKGFVLTGKEADASLRWRRACLACLR